jgi:hypothetical protein
VGGLGELMSTGAIKSGRGRGGLLELEKMAAIGEGRDVGRGRG